MHLKNKPKKENRISLCKEQNYFLCSCENNSMEDTSMHDGDLLVDRS